jgi:hypothetical protein
MITITGTVGSSGKYLVTGLPVDTTANAVLKIAFENNTSGTNLVLFAGTGAEFESGSGGMQLSDSAGPAFEFLTIIDTQQLSGKIIFVRREVGSANSQFTQWSISTALSRYGAVGDPLTLLGLCGPHRSPAESCHQPVGRRIDLVGC